MFKKIAFAALAATAAYAAPASAATITYLTGPAVALFGVGPGEAGAGILFIVSGTAGDFEATYTFDNPFDPALAGASATFNFDGDGITFTGGDFSGGGFFTTSTTTLGTSIQIDRFSLALGPQTLNIRGTFAPTGNSSALIGGELTLAQVPEPATWALFILGFGAIGSTMRRRSSKVRVAKASLNFA